MPHRTLTAAIIAITLGLTIPTAAAPRTDRDQGARGTRNAAERHARNELRDRAQDHRRSSAAEPRRSHGTDRQRDERPGSTGDRRPAGARTQDPGGVGNSGTIKVSTVGEAPDPSNEPHPGCALRVDLYGFRAGMFDLTISTHPPTGRELITSDVIEVTEPARGNELQLTRVYDVAALLPASEEGRWHLRIELKRRGSPGNGAKSKVVWLACAPGEAAAAPSDHADATTFAPIDESAVLGATLAARRDRSNDVEVAARAAAPADDLAVTGGRALRWTVWIALALLSIGLTLAILARPRRVA